MCVHKIAVSASLHKGPAFEFQRFERVEQQNATICAFCLRSFSAAPTDRRPRAHARTLRHESWAESEALHAGSGITRTSLLVFQKSLRGDCKMLRNVPFAILLVTRRCAYERFWVFRLFSAKSVLGRQAD